MNEISELEIRRAVKERYSGLANGTGLCCDGGSKDDSGSCCAPTLFSISKQIPEEAVSINAGCGSPLQLIKPEEGDSIVDLGSGGGIDVFKASALVGPTGKVIGVDSTSEMIWRSRKTAAKYADKYKNVEFRLGEIEHLPIETDSIDYAISNCVINLSPDKSQVFKEVFRVLKPNGIFAVADITVDADIPKEIREEVSSWSNCLSGALKESEYERMLYDAGFQDVRIARSKSKTTESGKEKFNFYSSEITAQKPAYFARKLGNK